MPIPPDVPPVSTASPPACRPAPRMLAVPSLTPATTGIPGRSPSAAAAAPVAIPAATRTAASPGRGTGRRRRPKALAASGAVSWPWTGRAASPDSHSPIESQLVSSQRARAIETGSWRASHAILGASPNPPSPTRRSCHVIAGRTGVASPSTATSVGPCPTQQMARTSMSRGGSPRLRADCHSARTAVPVASYQALGDPARPVRRVRCRVG